MSKLNRLLKKAHLLRCAQSPRSNVSVNTPPLVDFSRASHLDLLEQPGIIVFQQALKMRPILPLPDHVQHHLHGGQKLDYERRRPAPPRCRGQSITVTPKSQTMARFAWSWSELSEPHMRVQLVQLFNSECFLLTLSIGYLVVNRYKIGRPRDIKSTRFYSI